MLRGARQHRQNIADITRQNPLGSDETKNSSIQPATESSNINPFKLKALYILDGTSIMLCWGGGDHPK